MSSEALPKRPRQVLFSAPGVICGATLLLGVTGVLTIASGSMGGHGSDVLFFKQVLFLFFGFIVMSASAAIPFGFWRKSALPLGPWRGRGARRCRTARRLYGPAGAGAPGP